MINYIYNYLNSFDILNWKNIFITTSCVFIGSVFFINYKKKLEIDNLKGEINILKTQNSLLNKKQDLLLNDIDTVKNEFDSYKTLEYISDDNISLWNMMLEKPLYSLYKDDENFKQIMSFSENHHDVNFSILCSQLIAAEDIVLSSIESIFDNLPIYKSISSYEYNLVKHETIFYFSKIRFLLENQLISEEILRVNINAFDKFNNKPTLLYLSESKNIKLPLSFDVRYIKSFNMINKYTRSDISNFMP